MENIMKGSILMIRRRGMESSTGRTVKFLKEIGNKGSKMERDY